MHGTILVELRRYVESAHGASTWESLLASTGLAEREYQVFDVYPDAEVVALVGAAAAALGQDAREVLRGFGRFIAPDLLEMYWGAIRDEWRTLDVIENAERAIHTVVRADHPQATPPELITERPSGDEVVVRYSSPRRLCDVAKGIAEGLAVHFGETISIDETSCMLAGGDECRLVIRRDEA